MFLLSSLNAFGLSTGILITHLSLVSVLFTVYLLGVIYSWVSNLLKVDERKKQTKKPTKRIPVEVLKRYLVD